MFRTIPMADIKTRSDVEPALISGIGSPVGGIEPVNSVCCTKILRQLLSCYLSSIFYFLR